MVGFNYRMTDIQAVIDASRSSAAVFKAARRRELAARYQSAFRTSPGVTTPSEPEGTQQRAKLCRACSQRPSARDHAGAAR